MRRRLGVYSDSSVADLFLTLRWGTVLCQVLIFAAVNLFFAEGVPDLVLVLIGFEVASNLLFAWLIRERSEVPVALLTGVMFLDVALLTGLLALTGGAMNPFTFLYLVHVVVGAILLPASLAWGLAAFSAICYAAFFWPGLTLPAMGGHSGNHGAHLTPELRLHLQGMWVAYFITVLFVVFFGTRIQQSLSARREMHARLQEVRWKNERMASLATLSAGAAHEFATPLSTIAVASGELLREMGQAGNESWMADLLLIRSQVSRCRDILQQMAIDAGEPLGEGMETLTLGALAANIRAAFDPQHGDRLRVDCPGPETVVNVPRRSLVLVVRGLVTNAFHASVADRPVWLGITVEGRVVRFEVVDQGHGMDRETAERAREPFFTTRPAGEGLGLGLYLAAILAERLGGGLSIDSTPGAGTTVRFWIEAG